MEEIWKPVVGFETRYEVSNLGRVRSLPHESIVVRKKGKSYVLRKRGAYVSPQPRRHGYLGVWLYGNGGNNGRAGKQYALHRIVAEAFIENPTGYKEVNHINENKTDNRACNLEWCSHIQNSNHGTRGARIGEWHRENNRRRREAELAHKDGDKHE